MVSYNSTPLRGVDERMRHDTAHNECRQDEQKREGFILSSAPRSNAIAMRGDR